LVRALQAGVVKLNSYASTVFEALLVVHVAGMPSTAYGKSTPLLATAKSTSPLKLLFKKPSNSSA
jgi:hypothetical protein